MNIEKIKRKLLFQKYRTKNKRLRQEDNKRKNKSDAEIEPVNDLESSNQNFNLNDKIIDEIENEGNFNKHAKYDNNEATNDIINEIKNEKIDDTKDLSDNNNYDQGYESERSDDEWVNFDEKRDANVTDQMDDCYDSRKKNDLHPHCTNICATIQEKLRIWAIKFMVFHSIINGLLKILQDVLPCLPLCATTLLRTANNYNIVKFIPELKDDKSEFVYIGIAENLKRIVNLKNHEKEKVLLLQFNIDGLPLFKTGDQEFWPILGKIFFYPDIYKPFSISVYHGIGKPKLLHRYFKQFIEELNYLLENGLKIENELFKIEIMCFICDKPAKAFIKNIIGTN